MTSILKRKRGAVEVKDTPKRAKSTKNNGKDVVRTIKENSWEKALENTTEGKELVKVNVEESLTNGHTIEPEKSDSADVDAKENELVEDPKAQGEAAAGKSAEKASLWKLSESIGGRMSNLEPVFTADEKHLILISRTTVLVYTAATSLLTRSIKLRLSESLADTRIVSFCLSPTAPEIVWVACSDGNVYRVNWTSGEGAGYSWKTSSTGCIYMTVASMESLDRKRDIVLTTEAKGDMWRITANELTAPDSTIKTDAKTIYTSKDRIRYLKTAAAGSAIVAVSGNKIIVGGLQSTDYGTVDKIKYGFHIFETVDAVASLDVRATRRTGSKDNKKLQRTPIVDVVVGDVRGTIFVHDDLLANLQSWGGKPVTTPNPRKLHWHRQAVNAVKWSKDGNYLISGGNETVLAIWQLDTGSRQYLPHLSSTIQNIVVSPSGSSYAVQLADNSAMILSTAELVPTTHIAGIQASVLADKINPELEVARVQEEEWPTRLIQRTPALLDTKFPSKLLLAVGRIQEIDPVKPLVTGSPYLQTFDLESGHNSTRQALTRSNVTTNDTTPNAHAVSEPRVTHIKVSHNGKWMASVDEWTPPARDLAYVCSDKDGEEGERLGRREIYLKFWERSEDEASWNLVTRIDAPHTLSQSSSRPGRILDLAVDPNRSRFVTIGEDDVVCIWIPKMRKRDGVPVRNPQGQILRSWTCEHALSLGKQEILEEIGHLDSPVASACLAFSEDGSVFAAASSSHEGIAHFVDPNSGVIRQTQTGLFAGDLIKVAFIGQDLIMVANQLTVWDLVSNEIRMNFRLNKHMIKLSDAQKQEMVHLAVDAKSRSFAVAFPSRPKGLIREDLAKSFTYQQSELFIFNQDDAEPQLHEVHPSFITALIPAVDADGFILLDTSAEVRTCNKKGTQTFTAMAQSTSALNIEEAPTELNGVIVPEAEEADEEPEDDQLLTPAATEDGNEIDDENDTPVVTSQQLSNIFDIGPAFALPPLEEMFYQVAGLFSSKPLAQNVS